MGRTPINRIFTIQSIGSNLDYNWNSDFVFEGESHEAWEIVYVASGSVEVTEDSQIYCLSEGNIIFHAPFEFHQIRSAGNTSPHVLVQSFVCDGELPSKLREGVFLLSEQERSEYIEIFRCLGLLNRNVTTEKYAGQECTDSLSAFLIRLSVKHAVKEQIVFTRDTQIYKQLLDVMEKNVCYNCTLVEIAEMVPVSISYMKVLFERYAGVSPKNYYNRLRCTEAIRLLQSGISVTETAEKLMFSSQNYFSRFFKRMTGMAPVTYIRDYYNDVK